MKIDVDESDLRLAIACTRREADRLYEDGDDFDEAVAQRREAAARLEAAMKEGGGE